MLLLATDDLSPFHPTHSRMLLSPIRSIHPFLHLDTRPRRADASVEQRAGHIERLWRARVLNPKWLVAFISGFLRMNRGVSGPTCASKNTSQTCSRFQERKDILPLSRALV